MSLNIQWDSIVRERLDLPYNKVLAELSDEPRIVNGENSFITIGGKLAKRPGTISIDNTEISKRCDRLWILETLETPPKVYFLGSFYNSATGRWELYYNRLAANTGWVQVTSLRDVNSSTRPHEAVISRGLAYIKGFPHSGSSEKLGTVIIDGTGGSVVTRPWGLLGPTITQPARIVGAVNKLASEITDAAGSLTTTLNAGAAGFPAAPFVIQIDYEQITVTNVGGGTNWTITRGSNGTEKTEHDTNSIIIWRNWLTSAHKATVELTWKYTYAFKTITGQVSNRAPLETNSDKLPSSTGPFFDQIPKITIHGNSDTTNIPYLNIYRSTDGGGTYFRLKEDVINSGAGNIVFSDTYLETGTGGGTFSDPIPDNALNTAVKSPTLTSNSPPPTVLSPQVTGTDTPIASTPIVSYAGRLWYALGNVVFYSGNEEISEGIPEECFPSESSGNFFKFQFPVTNVAATADSLYVFTIQSTYQITGTNRETFSVRPIFDNIGHPYGHPRAITRFGDSLAFLTHDFRVAIINDNQISILSDALGTDLIDAADSGAEYDIKYWGDIEKEYLIVMANRPDNTLLSKQWVFDIKKSAKRELEPFWFTPWTIRATASISSRITETTGQRRMVYFIWNNVEETGGLVYLDPSVRTGTDHVYGESPTAQGYDFSVDFWLARVPAGNHVNALRAPAATPVIHKYSFDRTLFAGDTDPDCYYYVDDFWTTPIPVEFPEGPQRRNESIAYKTVECPINQVGQYVAIKLEKISTSELFEMQNLVITFNPDAGA